MKIGDIQLDHPYILGPMAGVTDLPFRILCKEQGAGMVCMEMVSAKALQFQNKNTKEMLRTTPEEWPVSLQLFGSEPEVMAAQGRALEPLPFHVIDINMGCPVPKVVKNGEGSALMKNPDLAYRIIAALAKSTTKPVTVKIRKGFDEKNINAVEMAKIAEAAGAKAVAVHGRTREEYYRGKADWEIIGQVKREVTIPVIGSGDIFSPQAAHEMRRRTGCDAVMVARGAQGNPWIFREILEYEKYGQVITLVSPEERKQTMMRHAQLLMAYKGEYTGIREMRKHASWYTRGLEGAARMRKAFSAVETCQELTELIRRL